MAKLFKRFFWPDTHYPFEDKRAVALALEALKDFKPDEVVILGDFQDCYGVSTYDKDPRRCFAQLKEELQPGLEGLAKIQNAAPKASFVYIEGNHEARIEKYINVYGGVLKDLLAEPREILRVPNKWTYLPYGQKNFYKMAGNLVACHGTVTNKHPTYSYLQKLGCSVIFGHTHKIQEVHVRKLNGEVLRGYNCGWLGDMNHAAEYIKDVADWTHGFATGLHDRRGWWDIKLHSIINGKVRVGDDVFGWKNR